MRHFTEQERALVVALYDKNTPFKDIAGILGAGENSLKRLLTELRLPAKRNLPPRHTPDQSLIGKTFEFCTIVGFEYEHGRQIWLTRAKCACGNIFNDTLRKISTGKRKTCGISGCPSKHDVRKRNGRLAAFTGHEEIYGCKWAQWRIGAEKRNIEFTITPEFAWNLFEKQNRKCALSGVGLEFGTAWNKACTASLDRIDSAGGYTEDNIQWVHKQINVMKRDNSDEEFIQWCKRVIEYRSVTDT